MRMHFISRLALLLIAGFLVVVSQVWTGGTLQWLFVAGGIVMILAAAGDSVRDNVGQRALDGLIALLGAWTIIEAFVFDGTNLKWWSFASAVALAILSVAGLIAHESHTERVVHELSVTTRSDRTPAAV
jgi:membrane protein YdbS with pleckstrin-like domain